MTKLHRRLTLAGVPVALILTLSLGTGVAQPPAPPAPQPPGPRSGILQIMKNCNTPGPFCTVTKSNLAEIPLGSTIIYDPPPGVSYLSVFDHNVVLFVGVGDWAVGRCTLNPDGLSGLCTFSDGVGPLAGFTARVIVSSTDGINYFWNGTYSFNPLPPY